MYNFKEVEKKWQNKWEKEGTFNANDISDIGAFGSGNTDCFFIQPNRGNNVAITCSVNNITLEQYDKDISSKERTIYIQPNFTLKASGSEETILKYPKIACTIPAYSNQGSKDYSLAIVDTTSQSIINLLKQYAEYTSQYNSSKVLAGYNKVTTESDGSQSEEWVQGSIEKEIDTIIFS